MKILRVGAIFHESTKQPSKGKSGKPTEEVCSYGQWVLDERVAKTVTICGGGYLCQWCPLIFAVSSTAPFLQERYGLG